MTSKGLHIAIQRSGDTIQFYINGEADAASATTYTAAMPDNTEPLLLGAGFLGAIDEVRLSNTARGTDSQLLTCDVTYVYNNANQLIEDYVTGKQMTAERNLYAYDANGNQQTVDTIVGDAAAPTRVISKKEMTYDVFNRQLTWLLSKPDAQGTLVGVKSESNTYRGDKWHRASSTSGGVTTNYLYDGDNVIADIVNGQVVKSYVTPMLDSNVSFTDHGTSATYYYNQDERQSVRNLTDATGAVVNAYDYSAFGDKLSTVQQSSIINQRYTFTGRELNDVSGDYYFRYRVYGALWEQNPVGIRFSWA